MVIFAPKAISLYTFTIIDRGGVKRLIFMHRASPAYLNPCFISVQERRLIQ